MKRLAVLLLLAVAACGGTAPETHRDVNPEGQVWKGTVLQVYQYFCVARASSPVEFTTASDGRFETTVTFTEVGSDCPIPIADLRSSQTVAGQLTDDRLTVEDTPTLSGTADRAGDRLSGTYTNSSAMDPNEKYTTTWELRCEKGCG